MLRIVLKRLYCNPQAMVRSHVTTFLRINKRCEESYEGVLICFVFLSRKFFLAEVLFFVVCFLISFLV